jgi:hypothetical protein
MDHVPPLPQQAVYYSSLAACTLELPRFTAGSVLLLAGMHFRAPLFYSRLCTSPHITFVVECVSGISFCVNVDSWIVHLQHVGKLSGSIDSATGI